MSECICELREGDKSDGLELHVEHVEGCES